MVGSRIVLATLATILASLTLQGCGGGGSAGGGGGGNDPAAKNTTITTTTTGIPTTTTTTTTTIAVPPPWFNLSILSYNNQGWEVVKNNEWDHIDKVIEREGPFDIMGMQECPDGKRILANLKQEGAVWDVVENHKHCTINHGATEDICIAWDSKKLKKLDSGLEVTEADGWCHRWSDWVRFEVLGMGTTMLFLNSHGAVHKCDANEEGQKTYERYIEIINAHRKPGDILMMTGDWNCPTHSLVVQKLLKTFGGGPEATPFSNLDHPDHIFHDPLTRVQLMDWKAFDGKPSDHQGLKAHYRVHHDAAAPAAAALVV